MNFLLMIDKDDAPEQILTELHNKTAPLQGFMLISLLIQSDIMLFLHICYFGTVQT